MNDRLCVETPARPEFVLPIRLFVSGVATRCNYTVEQIEDIRTAVSEACVMLLSGTRDGRLLVEIRTGDGLEIAISVAGRDGGPPEDIELSRVLVEAMSRRAAFCFDGEVCTRVEIEF